MAACLWAGGDAVLSFRAAGTLWQLDGVERGPIEVTVPRATGLCSPGVVVHRCTALPRHDRRSVEDIPVTSPERTLVDLAGVIEGHSLELALEDALRRGLTTPLRVQRGLQALGGRGRPGAGALRRLLDVRQDRPAESGLEVKLERFLRERGLDRFFVRQYEVWDGERRRRLDWAAPDHMVALEADSWRHHSGRAAWSADRARNDRLEGLGWRFVSVTDHCLTVESDLLDTRVRRVLSQAA
jgi:very-short-patch-repair endonuclease